MNLDKERDKLSDLEFEYNIARISKQDEEIVSQAKAKYTKQLNKVLKLQKMLSSKKKQQDSVIILEDLI